VLVLRSGIEKAFSAGVDVRDHRTERVAEMLDEVRINARRLLRYGPVTIASIHGVTLGGGLELAMLCDLVLSADDAVIGTPEIGLAAFPPIAAAWFPELCGWRRTMDLLMGVSLDANAALQAGLVTRVVPRQALDDEANRLAEGLAGRSAVALRAIKSVMRSGRDERVLARLDECIRIYHEQVAFSRDASEGIAAFLEKRAPSWSHR
jgi:cyclohexa-1,5-dienecarbonyl-CoA hydratase